MNLNVIPSIFYLGKGKKGKNEIKGDRDLELWHSWKGGDQAAKWELLNQFKPIISQYAQTHSNVLPKPVVEAKLKRYTLQAFDTYDPNKGAKLSTHVVNYFQKLNRDNYSNQQALRLPENVAIQYRQYNDAYLGLTERLNREPNTQELSEELGWSLDYTGKANRRYHKEYAEGKQEFDAGVHDNDLSESVLRFVYHDLDDKSKFFLEHRTGYLGRPIYSPTRIQTELKISPYQFYSMQAKVRAKVEEATGTLGRE